MIVSRKPYEIGARYLRDAVFVNAIAVAPPSTTLVLADTGSLIDRRGPRDASQCIL